MQRRNSALSLLIGILSLSLTAHATTYVVDQRHGAAADTNPGTREAPLKTVSAAAARAVAGDEVLVRPGVYREAVSLTNSGTIGKPIVFRSEEPRAAVISGSDIITAWNEVAPGVWSFPDPAIKKNSHDYGNGEWLYVNGVPMERADSVELLQPGSFLFDFEGKRVLLSPPEQVVLKDAHVEYARREGLFFPERPLNDIQIIGFTLIHNASSCRGKQALRISGQRWLVENNHVLWASYWGMTTFNCNEADIRSNLIEWCGDQGIGGAYTINMRVEKNVVRYNNWRRIDPGFEGGGSKWGSTFDSVVSDNEWYCNFGSGLWFDGANCNVIFEGNVAHDNSEWGLFTELCWDMILRNNISFNNGQGITIAETAAALVKNNIVFNSGIGIRIRGDGRRQVAGTATSWIPDYIRRIREIPGADSFALDRIEAGIIKYWIAPYPKGHLSNNSAIWENLVFDNDCNYEEYGTFSKPTPLAPWVNNFSDYNIWFNRTEKPGMITGDGSYKDLAEWRKGKERDSNSVELDPRAPDAKLPKWAEAKRKLWDIPLRPWLEVCKSLQLGLIPSPMACELMSRIFRSQQLDRIRLADGAIRAFAFDVEGQRTLAVWTTSPFDRRYLRLKIGQEEVVLENAYLKKTEKALAKGIIDLVVTYAPTYIRGVGAEIAEIPFGNLIAQTFNQPGETVPVQVVFANQGEEAINISAKFSVSKGFRAEPDKIEKSFAKGETGRIEVKLIPDGSLRKGTAQIRMEAQAGNENMVRMAAFGVGESTGAILPAPENIIIDGKLDDWKEIVSRNTPSAAISDISQTGNGDPKAWLGPEDLSGKIYTAWTKETLYVAIDVTDNSVIAAPPGTLPWDYDAVEVFIDGRSYEMQWQKEPMIGCYQIAVSPAKGETPLLEKFFIRNMEGAQIKSSLTEKGYIIEMGIPLTPANFPASDEWKAGRPIKMSVLINDKDDPKASGRKICLGWGFSPNGANHNDTSGWQTLRLKDEHEGK